MSSPHLLHLTFGELLSLRANRRRYKVQTDRRGQCRGPGSEPTSIPDPVCLIYPVLALPWPSSSVCPPLRGYSKRFPASGAVMITHDYTDRAPSIAVHLPPDAQPGRATYRIPTSNSPDCCTTLRCDDHHELSPANRGGANPMVTAISQKPPSHASRSPVIYITR